MHHCTQCVDCCRLENVNQQDEMMMTSLRPWSGIRQDASLRPWSVNLKEQSCCLSNEILRAWNARKSWRLWNEILRAWSDLMHLHPWTWIRRALNGWRNLHG